MLIPSRVFNPEKAPCLDFGARSTDQHKVVVPFSSDPWSSNMFSIFGWVRLNDLESSQEFFGRWSVVDWSTMDQWKMGISASGDLQPAVRDVNGISFTIQASISLYMSANTWAHVAIIHDGSVLTLYVDGGYVNSVACYGLNNVTDTDVWFGARPNNSFYMGGYLSNIAMFNRAVTLNELKYYMYRYLTGREPGLVGYYPFLDGAGTTLKDWSNNGNNGTIYGATWAKGIANA